MTGRTREPRHPRYDRLGAACVAALAWTLFVAEAAPTPSPRYVVLLVGVAVTLGAVSSLRLCRGCPAARLVSPVLALLVLASQVLVGAHGTPAGSGGQWSAAALTTVALACGVLVTAGLDARLRGRIGTPERPYAR